MTQTMVSVTKWLMEISGKFLWLNVVAGVALVLFSFYLISRTQGTTSINIGKVLLGFSLLSLFTTAIRLFL